jgi:hypothetical protein
MYITKITANNNQDGAVFIVFLGIMISIMSAASLLQQHYATNDNQIMNNIIKQQTLATAESAVNITRKNIYELIIIEGDEDAVISEPNTSSDLSDLSQCIQRLGLNNDNLLTGTGISPISQSFAAAVPTHYTSAILSHRGNYKIIVCGYNQPTLVGSDVVSALVQTVENNTLSSLNWLEH